MVMIVMMMITTLIKIMNIIDVNKKKMKLIKKLYFVKKIMLLISIKILAITVNAS